MRIFLILSTLTCALSAFASPSAPTAQEFQDLMKLDYQSFDQNLPEGGWRGITDNVEAGKTLDAYHVQNIDALSPDQARVIFWHAGQVYAMADLKDLAVSRFSKSYDSDEKPDAQFKWNAYVRGSIAFLQQDRAELQKARDEMNAADPSEHNVNRKVLEGLLKCFDQPYRVAYGTCRP